MAQQYHHNESNALQQNPMFIYESLYCLEDNYLQKGHENSRPIIFQEHDMCWDNEELVSLLSKEEKNQLDSKVESNPSLVKARCEAVEWILKVNAHYSFTALTSVLAVNYLDRFLFSGSCVQTEKPWITQLAAVACVSIAAKMEEVQVPLLLDFQVVESKYFFEAKTIQRMEILILSTLKWQMNRVTPLSFLDYITRRIGLKDHLLCSEFLRRCELTVLSIISDSRSMKYAPSVTATAAVMHVINGIEPCLGAEYQSQLLGILGTDKDNIVEECYQLMFELHNQSNNKRKFCEINSIPSSPNGVIDVEFSSDSSNDSWSVLSLSVNSSPEPLSKKSRTLDQRLLHSSTDLLGISR